jgi:hypothetical protein
MLEIRTTCESCNKKLPFNSTEAMICTFECTFCKEFVDSVLKHVCPNCGGDFQLRPIRPENHLKKYTVSSEVVFKPVDIAAHLKYLKTI